MTKLSKYALKQLSDEGRTEYYAELEAEENNYRRVYGGKIYITEDSEGNYYLESFDLDNYRIEDTFCLANELDDYLERLEEELADIHDGHEEEENER